MLKKKLSVVLFDFKHRFNGIFIISSFMLREFFSILLHKILLIDIIVCNVIFNRKRKKKGNTCSRTKKIK